MSVFTKLVKPGEGFFYQRGEVITTTPWLRPNYYRVKAFLKEVKESSDIFSRYESYIMGGVLLDFNTTWDLDIGLVGGNESNEELEEALNYINDIALNKYHILADTNWYPAKQESLTYSDLVENEFLHKNTVYKTIGYIKKQIGKEVEEVDLRLGKDVTVLTEYLVKRDLGDIRYKEKVISRVQNNKKGITVLSFSIDEFLKTDEAYFTRHTNITND
jgi:hypothetical protein